MADYTKWPTPADVMILLRSAGVVSRLDAGDLTDRLLGALAESVADIETLTGPLRQFPRDTAPSTLTYTPEGSRSIQIRDAVEVTGVSWQPYGTTAQALVVDRDYSLEDAGAASRGRPYTVLEFGGWCGWAYGCSGTAFRNALKVTGIWGWPTIPANLWQACAKKAAIQLAEERVFVSTGDDSGGRVKKDAAGTASVEYFDSGDANKILSWASKAASDILRLKRVTL